MMYDDLSVPELSAMLKKDADAVARHLLPGGVYSSGEWKVSGSDSPTGESISVVIRGPKQGLVAFWNDARQGGDLIDLVQRIDNCSLREAIQWAKNWLGVDNAPRRNFATNTQRDDRDIDWGRLKKLETAKGIWNDSGPISGAATTYLVSRGIDPRHAADDHLRFHVGLPHPEGGSFPAIIARVVGKDGAGSGIWRVYLKPDGSGKAPVAAPRLGLGNIKGGAVRIGGVRSEIGLAEGIETALAGRQLCGLPVWAALSTSGMRGFEVPAGVMRFRVFVDHDTPKFKNGRILPSPGLSAAEDLKARMDHEGIETVFELPPHGMDWLDVLNDEQKRKTE